MKRPNNLKVGDMFRVIEGVGIFKGGDIITLKEDDGTDWPYFWNNADKSFFWSINFSRLEPYPKTIRDVQVGDVVVGEYSGDERMVLERGQNTVVLSYADDFKKSDDNFTFDELEKQYTLKTEPVVDDKTAEAMKLLKEAGYKISKD